jgi:predicted DNA-binding protein
VSAKTRQVNLRLDEKALDELRDLSEVVGDTQSNIIRDLISKAYKKLTPGMLASLEKKRAEERSVRAKVIG